MENIPVLGFAGYSGSGKTTLIERLLPALARRGLSAAVLKHHGHAPGLDWDREDSDSRRFSRAGAAVSAVSSATACGWTENRPLSLSQLLSRLRDVDIVLVEGFKDEPISQIGLSRASAGRELPAPPWRYVALVTEEETPGVPTPRFGFDDVEALADFIAENRRSFGRI